MIEVIKHLLLAFVVGLLLISLFSKIITVPLLSGLCVTYVILAVGVGTIQLVLSFLGAVNND